MNFWQRLTWGEQTVLATVFWVGSIWYVWVS